MANQFLTNEQQVQLRQNNWSVTPDCAYIELRRDEITPQAWDSLCEHLQVSNDRSHVIVLYVGVQ